VGSGLLPLRGIEDYNAEMRFRLRTLLILLAMLPPLVAGIGYQLLCLWSLSRTDLPRSLPTMFGEHAGIAVALACVTTIVIVLALRTDAHPATR
jgi:hypothetical protein